MVCVCHLDLLPLQVSAFLRCISRVDWDHQKQWVNQTKCRPARKRISPLTFLREKPETHFAYLPTCATRGGCTAARGSVGNHSSQLAAVVPFERYSEDNADGSLVNVMESAETKNCRCR
eukprot:scaffold5377_cov19-Prasinocladus_malaysianus.AAC.1